jgi:hypothetical protein
VIGQSFYPVSVCGEQRQNGKTNMSIKFRLTDVIHQRSEFDNDAGEGEQVLGDVTHCNGVV